MKRTPIICLSLLLISGPMQNPGWDNAYPGDAQLQLYWLKRTKKEILRTEQNPLLLALNNSMHFVAQGVLKKLFPVLDN
jgi:hypothetical protein